jgi:hypothetical protein
LSDGGVSGVRLASSAFVAASATWCAGVLAGRIITGLGDARIRVVGRIGAVLVAGHLGMFVLGAFAGAALQVIGHVMPSGLIGV